MPQNFYELVWIFIIYAFLGWCTEVSYAALDTGKFVNRGFLNGPYCPIYGCGVVIVVAILTPLKENLFILFVGSFLLTSVLEFITGFLLEKVFHNKWWDYSNKPFNIMGYVCLKFSIYWGLACTFIMDILHPIIYKAITTIPFVVGVVFLVIIMTAFAIDMCVTVSTILKFNKQLKLLNDVAEQIHKISDEIGENIYENVNTVIEKSEEFQETHAELIEKVSETKDKITDIPENTIAKIGETTSALKNALTEKAEETRLSFDENVMEAKSGFEARKEAYEARKEAYEEKKSAYSDALKEKLQLKEELTEKYQRLLESKNKGFKRLLKAFPDMKSKNENEALNRFRNYLKERDEKNKTN